MKRVGIAITDPSDWTAIALCNAVRHFGMQPVKFDPGSATSDIRSGKIYSSAIDLISLDAVIVRDLGPSTKKDISFRFDILSQIAELGIAVINTPDSIARAANKYASSYLFWKNGISAPKTIVTSNRDDALAALSLLGHTVVKPVFGYKGIGVERIENNEKGELRLTELLERNNMLYMQEFIPNPGRDIRVFVVDDEIAGSIYRVAPPMSWINNLSQGGSARQCVLTGEQERVALKSAQVIGTVYAGVDIIEGDKDYVIEINGTPSGKGIFEACNIDVTAKIAEYLKRLIT
jgi:tetrahydromethanopterin:alpha-L-glutamate ligase